MGHAKQLGIEQDEQGWDYTEGFVCTECVDDEALVAILAAHEDNDQECSYCGRRPAAKLNILIGAFVDGLRNEYGDADNEGVGWDGREGGYQWTTLTTYDVVAEFAYVLTGERLFEDLLGAIHDRAWVEKDFAWRRRDEVLNEAWDRFCYAVKYETRYVLWLLNTDDEEDASTGEVPPARILSEVGELIERLDGMLRPLRAGEGFWRARAHKARERVGNAKDLGTVPRARAKQANRMSPAGIPMFYGSQDPATAIEEVAYGAKRKHITAGRFVTSRECTVVDFTALPPVPSVFDPELGSMHRFVSFLHRFRDQLSEPLGNGVDQIEYVPTQIVTEYLLRVFGHGSAVHGLLYNSALDGKLCAVLDVTNDCCVEQGPDWKGSDDLRLGLDPGSIETRRTV